MAELAFPVKLRYSPSGPAIEGVAEGQLLQWDQEGNGWKPVAGNPNDGEVLTWDDSSKTWVSAPASGGGTLSGDANGPALSNEVHSVSPDVGGTNVDLGDFTSDPAQIRPVVRQPAGGDIETVSLATFEAALTGLTEFDHIITDRASLIAAVGAGPVYTLTSGSYAFKNALTLPAGERLEVAGGEVLLMGMGPTKVVTSSGLSNAMLTVSSGTVQLITMNITAGATGEAAVQQTGGTITAYNCNFVGGSSSDGVQQDGGEWSSVSGTFSGGASGFRHDGSSAGSTCRMQGGTIEGDFSAGCWVGQGAGNDIRAYVSNVNMRNDNASNPTIFLNGASSGDFFFNGCKLEHSADDQQIAQVTTVSTFVFEQCDIYSTATTPGDGIQVSGAIGGGGIINACTFLDLDDAIREATLTDIERLTISSCDFGGTINVGIDWDASDIPSHGMMIVGNNFGPATTVFQGFDENTARVNIKACSENAGLLAETSIVP